MKKIHFILLLFITLSSTFFACRSPEKEIAVSLPEYTPKIVVEAYMEKGKPFSVLLSYSQSFFDEPDIPIVKGASINLSDGVTTYTLVEVDLDSIEQFQDDPVALANYLAGVCPKIITDPNYFSQLMEFNKPFNYFVCDSIDFNYNQYYTLTVDDNKGTVLTAQAKILPPVTIDQTSISTPNSEGKSNVLAQFQDNSNENNFYRFVNNKNSLLSEPDNNFQFEADILNGEQIVLGSNFIYESGDTAWLTVYHLTSTYYDFLETAELAFQANGNPFAQPTTIKTNIIGGMGIFAGLSYDRKMILIP